MTQFIPVAKVADVPEGNGLRAQVKGHKVTIFNIDGEIHVFQDFCREGADLSKAVVSDEGDLLCPHHGWRFDIREGVCTMVPDCKVIRYPVRVEGGQILVGVD